MCHSEKVKEKETLEFMLRARPGKQRDKNLTELDIN